MDTLTKDIATRFDERITTAINDTMTLFKAVDVEPKDGIPLVITLLFSHGIGMVKALTKLDADQFGAAMRRAFLAESRFQPPAKRQRKAQ